MYIKITPQLWNTLIFRHKVNVYVLQAYGINITVLLNYILLILLVFFSLLTILCAGKLQINADP